MVALLGWQSGGALLSVYRLVTCSRLYHLVKVTYYWSCNSKVFLRGCSGHGWFGSDWIRSGGWGIRNGEWGRSRIDRNHHELFLGASDLGSPPRSWEVESWSVAFFSREVFCSWIYWSSGRTMQLFDIYQSLILPIRVYPRASVAKNSCLPAFLIPTCFAILRVSSRAFFPLKFDVQRSPVPSAHIRVDPWLKPFLKTA